MVDGLQALDPAIALKAKQIQNMPPDKAISYLLQNGVDSRTAAMVMRNIALKKQGQQAAQQAPPRSTVAQDLGVAGMPVNPDMFNEKNMAGGGIVAFDEGGYLSGPAMGAPGNISPLDMGAMQQYAIAQNMATQQQQAQAQQLAQAQAQASQAGLAGLARGGKVKHFDAGGVSNPEDQVDPNTGYPLNAYPDMARPLISGEDIARWSASLSPYKDPVQVPGVAPSAAHAAAVLAAQPPQGPAQGGPPQGPPASLAPKPPSPTPPVPKPPMPGQQQQSNSQSVGLRGPGGGIPGPLQNMMTQQQAQLAQQDPNSPQNSAAGLLERNVQLANSQGIGAAAQNHLQDLEQRKQQIQDLAQQGKWMALAQAGAAMAQAATQNPHGGFLGALAVGGAKGAEEYGKTIAQYHSQLANIQDQQYLVAQSQENLKYDMSKQAQQEHEKLVDRYDRSLTQLNDTQYKATALVYSKEIAAMNARAIQNAKAMYNPSQIFAERMAYEEPGSPEYLKDQQRMKDYYGAQANVQAAGVRAAASEQESQAKIQQARETALMQLKDHPAYQSLENQLRYATDPTKRAAIQAQIQDMVGNQTQLVLGPPPGFSNLQKVSP